MTTFRGAPPETEDGMGALTLSGFLLEVTRHHPEREAVVFHEPDGAVVRWSYRDLEREARRVAHAVLGTGAGKDSRVGILMGNRPEWVAALYGVALAGAVAVPLNTYFEPPELDYVLRHSDAKLLLTQTRCSVTRTSTSSSSCAPTSAARRRASCGPAASRTCAGSSRSGWTSAAAPSSHGTSSSVSATWCRRSCWRRPPPRSPRPITLSSSIRRARRRRPRASCTRIGGPRSRAGGSQQLRLDPTVGVERSPSSGRRAS